MIELDVVEQVHVLRMCNTENRFNRSSLDALNAALDKIEQSEAPTALVTTGEGKFYSNGLDLDWMGSSSQAEALENVQRVHELLGRILTFPMITIAAVNGHAFAAGAMLMLAHDFRLMRADRGFFCLPEVDIQIPFTPAMTAVIQARLATQTAHEVMVTGKRYGGQLAAERGIVEHAVSESELLPKAIELAKGLLGKHRGTLSAIKRAAYADAVEKVRVARAQLTQA